MPWARFDDDYLTNTKMLAADKDALLLHMASVVYCAKRLTDGFVPTTALKALAIMGKVTEPGPAVANLIELDLWQAVEGGWQVHDYLVYNPSREQVEAVSQARAETGRLGGQRSGESREAKSKQFASGLLSKSEAKSNPVPVPVPQESLTSETVGSPYMAQRSPRNEPDGAKPPRYSPSFETFWKAYPNGDGRAWPKPATYAEWQRLKPDGELADAILAGETAWRSGRDWQRGYVLRPDRWLKQRSWEDPPEPWSGVDETDQRAPPETTKYSVHHIDSERVARDFDQKRQGASQNGQHPGAASGLRTLPGQLAAEIR